MTTGKNFDPPSSVSEFFGIFPETRGQPGQISAQGPGFGHPGPDHCFKDGIGLNLHHRLLTGSRRHEVRSLDSCVVCHCLNTSMELNAFLQGPVRCAPWLFPAQPISSRLHTDPNGVPPNLQIPARDASRCLPPEGPVLQSLMIC